MIEDSEISLFAELPPEPFVIDGGAGKGEWTEALLAARPKASVWCFEANPRNAAVCRRVFRKHPNVTVHQYAISSRSGSAILYTDEDVHEFGCSLHRRIHHRGMVEVQCVPLGSLMPAHVDLLKLDIEGHELAALGGLGELRPGLIQFEHGGTWEDAGTDVRNAYTLLEAMGYALTPEAPPVAGEFINVVARKKKL